MRTGCAGSANENSPRSIDSPTPRALMYASFSVHSSKKRVRRASGGSAKNAARSLAEKCDAAMPSRSLLRARSSTSIPASAVRVITHATMLRAFDRLKRSGGRASPASISGRPCAFARNRHCSGATASTYADSTVRHSARVTRYSSFR